MELVLKEFDTVCETEGFIRKLDVDLVCEVIERDELRVEGGEERRDNNGRAYYFDHNTRTTQLERPEFEVGGMVSNRSSSSLRDDFLERRTISMEDALVEVEETAEVQDGGDPWWLESDPFLENDEGVWSGSQSVDAEPGSPDSALPPESQESQEEKLRNEFLYFLCDTFSCALSCLCIPGCPFSAYKPTSR